MLSKLQLYLMPLSFALLFFLMILYWVQAAFFSYRRYKKLNNLVFFLCFCALTSLLLMRWLESGHFPLSNLYESLLFLSWSCLVSQLVLQLGSNQSLNSSGDKIPELSSDWIASPEPIGDWITSQQLRYKTPEGSMIQESKEQLGISFAGQSQAKQGQLRKDVSAQEKVHMGSSASNTYISDTIETTPSLHSYTNTNKYESVDVLGVIVSPLALISYTFAFLYLPKEMQKATALVPALQSNWLMMHVTVMILGYSALLCGCVLSMAFLVVDSLPSIEKHDEKKLTGNTNLRTVLTQKAQLTRSLNSSGDASPELLSDRITSHLCERLDNLSYRMLGFGFPLLTVGIISGAVWANSAWGSYWSWDPKETWALITWLVFAIYFHARITNEWSGKRAARIATLGFFVVWFCYLGVNLLGTGLHSYGWFNV